MSGIVVRGVGVLSTLGRDPAELAAALPGPRRGPGATDALADFDTRSELGRKGTSCFDRRTALTVVACRQALQDAGLDVAALDSARVGVVLGTTAGSVKSSVDFAVETFVQDRPYLVNPALFPTTVMNCPAGQTAIWFGLRGVNATIAGGAVALLSVLRYCENLFRGHKADVLLGGVVEERTDHTEWLGRAGGPADGRCFGEGGAVVVLSGSGTDDGSTDAEILGTALGFAADPGDRPAVLARCVRKVLAAAQIGPGAVRVAALSSGPERDQDQLLWKVLCAEVGDVAQRRLERLSVLDHVGDCGSATAALELAAVLGRHRHAPELDGQLYLLAAHTPEGAVGAAVVRGRSRGAAGR